VTPERLLVTGASGFLGSEIVRQAAASGRQVKALSYSRDVHPNGCEAIRTDIRDPAAVRAAVADADVVIHAAGLAHVFTPTAAADGHFDDINHAGTLNVALAAAQAGVRHLILVSSVAVYGRSDVSRNEQSACRPDGAYGLSKLRGEHGTAEVAAGTGMTLTVLRLATIYGEQDPGNIARLIRAIDQRRFIQIGEGSNRKSLIYRGDAARACLLASTRVETTPVVFNVTSPAVTTADIVEAIAGALGMAVPSLRIPSAVGRACARIVRRVAPGGGGSMSALASSIDKWLSHDEYDGRMFESALGFVPAIGLKEGMKRAVARYLEQPDTNPIRRACS
jgi:nucleoside-diphosphate-sugar epimerase